MFREVPDRTVAENLRGAYLEAVVDPAKALGRGQYFWHEVIGTEVRGIDGVQLGKVHDLYRVGETEVLVVRGGPHAEFDVPVVRSFIRVFAPRRGEIVVDAVALDLGAPPGAPDPDEIRPRAPRRRTRRSRAPRPETVGEAQPVTTLDGLTHGGRADPGSTVAEPDLPDQAG